MPQSSAKQSNERGRILLLAGLFVFLLWIAYTFVPTGDDWNRIVFSNRTPQGFLNLVVDHYQTLNGRVVGNFLSYLLIAPWTRALAKVFSILLLTRLLSELSRIKGPLALFFAFFFVMTVPRLIFIQVYPWSAGFYNYVPPMIGVLLLFVEILPLFEGKELEGNTGKSVLWFLGGILLCLFVEHVTLFLLCFSSGLLLFQKLRRNTVAPFTKALFAGVLCGTALMFASPVYRQILTADDSYRTVPASAGHFVDILVQNYRSLSRYMLFESPVFLLIVCAVVIGSYVTLHRGVLRRPGAVWFAVLPVYVVLTRLVFRQTFLFTPEAMRAAGYWPLFVDAGFHVVTFLLLLGACGAIRYLPARRQYLFTLLCIPVITAPLFVVRPVLARNYYASYLFLAIAVLLLLRELIRRRKLPVRKMAVLLPVLCAGILLFYGSIYTLNQISFRHRIDVIESAMEREENPIIIPDFPVPFFIFGPGDSSLGHAYYYEKANDIEFILESEHDAARTPEEPITE